MWLKRAVVVVTVFAFTMSGSLLTAFPAYAASRMVPSVPVAAMLRARQVMIGYEDGDMRWENTVTRAEAVKILLAAIGEVAPSLSRSPMAFLDVSRSHWAFGHITMAAEIGLVRGRPGNVFDPEQGVTMAEFMVMVSRVYGGLGGEAGAADPRVSVEPTWAAPEIVGWPDLVDLVTGESVSVNLDYPASRGEVGVLTGRMMERLGLAYDLAGMLEDVDTVVEKAVLTFEDGGVLMEVSVAEGALWFSDGMPAEASSLIGHRVSLVLDDVGKVVLVVRM